MFCTGISPPPAWFDGNGDNGLLPYRIGAIMSADQRDTPPQRVQGKRVFMTSFDPTLLILLGLAALGIISHNMTVTWAMLALLAVRLTPLNHYFPLLEKYGLSFGVLILTIAVIAPLASGKISANEFMHAFVNWKSLLAIAIGIVVSWLGGRGVSLMSNQPSVVSGLLIGTVMGVALFRGVPVGPLIAAGLLSLLIGKT